MQRPKSSGRVTLKSRNPLHKPIIEPNYFAHREDIDVLIEGIRIACNISNQPSMQRFGSRVHRIPFPGCRHLPFDSDEYWECSIRQVCLHRTTNLVNCVLLMIFFFILNSLHLQSIIRLAQPKWGPTMMMEPLSILGSVFTA